MPSLTDLVRPELTAKDIETSAGPLTVRGIKAKEWAQLYSTHPILRFIVSGRKPEGDNIVIESMHAQAALIAAAAGKIGDEAEEEAAMENLSAEDMEKIIDVVLRMSYPGHVFRPLLRDGR
jgi:hypothetical protein